MAKIKLELDNRTHYLTRDLRGIILAGLRAKREYGYRHVTVEYSRGNYCTGMAALHGRWIIMRAPRDPRIFCQPEKIRQFAQVLLHEIEHNQGFEHRDQVNCYNYSVPWIEGREVRVKPTKPQLTTEEKRAATVAKREAQARAAVPRWEAKLAEAEARVKRCKRALAKARTRVRYYDRKRAAETGQVGTQVARELCETIERAAGGGKD